MHNDSSNTEYQQIEIIKKNPMEILELKSTLTETNNSPEESQGRSELTTERCSKLEDAPTESMQPKDQRGKKN